MFKWSIKLIDHSGRWEQEPGIVGIVPFPALPGHEVVKLISIIFVISKLPWFGSRTKNFPMGEERNRV